MVLPLIGINKCCANKCIFSSINNSLKHYLSFLLFKIDFQCNKVHIHMIECHHNVTMSFILCSFVQFLYLVM